MRRFAWAIGCLVFAFLPVLAGGTPATPGARVAFGNLKDGAIVASPVHVTFVISGMTLAPAGDQTPGTGHHHVLIDQAIDLKNFAEAIPLDAHHIHFGKGQSEADITLSPGPHRLQLLLGDWTHVPHEPPIMSEVIHITVK